MPERYRYQPLVDEQDIRLLQVSASPDGRILFRLLHTSFEATDNFQALSYTWGSTIRENEIYEVTTGNVLYVTQNCAAALRSLAGTEEKPLRIWVSD